MSKIGKVILTLVIILLIAAAGAAVWYFFFGPGKESQAKSNETAYVDSVAQITGNYGASGTQNIFAGVVEAQESKDITKSENKTIKEIFVSVGDEVSVGTPLFEYDVDKTELDLAQARIDLEGLENDITGYYNQISQLTKDKAKASASEQLEYTTQIQAAELSVRRTEYNKKSKEAEIAKLEADLENTVVTSDMNGVIKALNPNGEMDYYTGNVKPFMTIMARGDYQIKGKVNEQNVYTLYEGMPVIIRSRVSSDITWTGTINRIDTSTTYSDNNDNNGVVYYGGGGDSGQTSSNYAFYITPDTSDRLMLGQHVFIEPDYGQDNERTGLWISSMYLVEDGGSWYAWVAGEKNRLEYRKLGIGDYDSNMDEYEILSGLTLEDYIAFPGNLLHEGMNCVINDGMHSNSDEGDYEGGNEGNFEGGFEGDFGGDNEGGFEDAPVFDGAEGAEDIEGFDGAEGAESGEVIYEEGAVIGEEGITVDEEGNPVMDGSEDTEAGE